MHQLGGVVHPALEQPRKVHPHFHSADPAEVDEHIRRRGEHNGPGTVTVKQGTDDAPLPDDGHLQAAREMFAGAWDIVEVSGRYVAVPDGTQIVWSATIGGLVGKLRNRGDAGEAE